MQQGRTKLVRESIAVKMSSSCGHLVITKNLGVSGNECWHLDGHHLWESPNTKTLSDGHHLWEESFIQHCHDKKYKKSKPGENFEKDKIYANLKCFTNIFKVFSSHILLKILFQTFEWGIDISKFKCTDWKMQTQIGKEKLLTRSLGLE